MGPDVRNVVAGATENVRRRPWDARFIAHGCTVPELGIDQSIIATGPMVPRDLGAGVVASRVSATALGYGVTWDRR